MTGVRLSYVVQADAWATLTDTIGALAGQGRARDVELVAVAPGELGDPPVAAAALGGVTTVIRPLVPSASARAAGIEAASGDVVAIGETHVALPPEWADSVLQVHDAGADAVVPTLANANPGTRLAWTAFLLDYGRYRGPAPNVTVPTYNATVRRDALPTGPGLRRALEPGPYLDRALRSAGATVRPAAVVVRHLNVDVPGHWLRERVLSGLLIGDARAARWRWGRRLAYAAAFPAIGVVLFARALRLDRSDSPRGTLVTVGLACALTAVGEALGYLGLCRPADQRAMAAFELHKARFTRSGP